MVWSKYIAKQRQRFETKCAKTDSENDWKWISVAVCWSNGDNFSPKKFQIKFPNQFLYRSVYQINSESAFFKQCKRNFICIPRHLKLFQFANRNVWLSFTGFKICNFKHSIVINCQLGVKLQFHETFVKASNLPWEDRRKQ